MASRIRQLTVDAADVALLTAFWTAVLDGEVLSAPGARNTCLRGGHGEIVYIQRSDTPKTAKNRLHVDLQPTDHGRDQEVDRLLALGATMVDDLRRAPGEGFAVLADPEGNELCVEAAPWERPASPGASHPVWSAPPSPAEADSEGRNTTG